jgi:hypothetical protein
LIVLDAEDLRQLVRQIALRVLRVMFRQTVDALDAVEV